MMTPLWKIIPFGKEDETPCRHWKLDLTWKTGMSLTDQVCGFQSIGHPKCGVNAQQMPDVWVFLQRRITTGRSIGERENAIIVRGWLISPAQWTLSNSSKTVTWYSHHTERLYWELLGWEEIAARLEPGQQHDRDFWRVDHRIPIRGDSIESTLTVLWYLVILSICLHPQKPWNCNYYLCFCGQKIEPQEDEPLKSQHMDT